MGIPPELQRLGYERFVVLHDLDKRIATLVSGQVHLRQEWSAWRGILEYLACVEHARLALHAFPKGTALGSKDVVPAKYHSASMVFFAQAALDNLAEWLAERAPLTLAHRDRVFHSDRLRQALASRDAALGAIVDAHLPYIKSLARYRHTWIHRLSGGAQIFCDRNPGEPGAVSRLMVPIDPTIYFDGDGDLTFAARVQATRAANSGEWLYPVEVFADRTTDGCRDFLLAIATRSMEIFR